MGEMVRLLAQNAVLTNLVTHGNDQQDRKFKMAVYVENGCMGGKWNIYRKTEGT